MENSYLNLLVNGASGADQTILNYRDFISTLRGPSNESRNALLETIFDEISPNGDSLPLEVFTKYINCSTHPLCFFGGYSERDVTSHIVDCFSAGKAPFRVSKAAFVDYFTDISVVLDEDEYFEGTVRNILGM